MKTLRRKICLAGLCLLGLCLLGGGGYGFLSLADAADEYLLTTGVVGEVRRERVFRTRKVRCQSDVVVRYETTLYGPMHITLDFHVPFLMDEGDTMRILYNPRLPHRVRLPGWESLLYSILLAGGIGLVGLSAYLGRRGKASV